MMVSKKKRKFLYPKWDSDSYYDEEIKKKIKGLYIRKKNIKMIIYYLEFKKIIGFE